MDYGPFRANSECFPPAFLQASEHAVSRVVVACSSADFPICRSFLVARMVSGVRHCVCFPHFWLLCGCSIQEFSSGERPQAKS